MPTPQTAHDAVRQINAWVDDPNTIAAPVCGHDKTHGKLRAEILDDDPDYQDVIMSCTQCDYKQLGIPFDAVSVKIHNTL